jgi:hypothetical protein
LASQIVTLTAVDIEYQGQSIGREISVQIDLAGELAVFDKRVAAGQAASINSEIAQFWIDAGVIDLQGNVRIVERDPVHSEFTDAAIAWSPRLGAGAEPESLLAVAVEVAEVRPEATGISALFTVRLQARAVPAARFVLAPESGWLKVRLDEIQSQVSLPETLHVEITRIAEGREHFIIKEGSHKGRRASVRLAQDGSSLLSTDDPRTPAARLIYSVSRKSLTLGTRSYACIDYPATPWQQGIYDIELPDAPHKGGLNYPEASRARTWFRVGHTGDRYIHTGAASAGCITVVERGRWDELCAALVRSRKGDGISIGTVQVVD